MKHDENISESSEDEDEKELIKKGKYSICIFCKRLLKPMSRKSVIHYKSHFGNYSSKYVKHQERIDDWIRRFLDYQESVINNGVDTLHWLRWSKYCPVCRVFQMMPIQGSPDNKDDEDNPLKHVRRHLKYSPFNCSLCPSIILSTTKIAETHAKEVHSNDNETFIPTNFNDGLITELDDWVFGKIQEFMTCESSGSETESISSEDISSEPPIHEPSRCLTYQIHIGGRKFILKYCTVRLGKKVSLESYKKYQKTPSVNMSISSNNKKITAPPKNSITVKTSSKNSISIKTSPEPVNGILKNLLEKPKKRSISVKDQFNQSCYEIVENPFYRKSIARVKRKPHDTYMYSKKAKYQQENNNTENEYSKVYKARNRSNVDVEDFPQCPFEKLLERVLEGQNPFPDDVENAPYDYYTSPPIDLIPENHILPNVKVYQAYEVSSKLIDEIYMEGFEIDSVNSELESNVI